MVTQNGAPDLAQVLPIWPAADASLIQQVHAALDREGFDAWVESLCQKYSGGNDDPQRPQLAASFRLILIALLEDNWHAQDSDPSASSPTLPSSLGQIAALHPCRKTFCDSGVGRVPLSIHRWVLAHAIEVLTRQGVLAQRAPVGRFSARRSPPLANLVHKETGEAWVNAALIESAPHRH